MGSLKVHCVHFKGGSVFKVSAKLLSAKCSVTGWFLWCPAINIPAARRHYSVSFAALLVVCCQSTLIRKAVPVCFYSALRTASCFPAVGAETAARRARPCLCALSSSHTSLFLSECVPLSVRVFERRFREGSFSCSIEPLFACPVITCLLRCPLLPDPLLPSLATLKSWLSVDCWRSGGDVDGS